MTATTTPTPGAEHQVGRRQGFTGLLPARMIHHREPRWWQEVAIIGFCYWLYSEIRNMVPEQESIAMRHALSIQKLQDSLHLNFELSVNRFVAAHEPIAQVMDYYYATLHFIITIGALVWLYRAHPRIYRGARTVLFATSLIALAGFYLYPLAPPRLLPRFGYIDTLAVFHTWGSLADPKVAAHSNQFAAMPSLHIGWSLWCGIALFRCAHRLWVRVLGLAYPVFTLLVIVGTANHFTIDAVAGLLVFLAACGIQYLMSGHGAFQKAPRHPTHRDAAVSDPGADPIARAEILAPGASGRQAAQAGES